MLFAIDVGNSSITLGCLFEGKLLYMEQLSTNSSKTNLEYAIDFKNMFELHGIKIEDITGSIISSVVPQLTEIIKSAIKKITKLDALVIGPGLKTGLHITIDDPAQLGSDLVVGAVAALKEYAPPLAIIDMGTATTIAVINKDRKYIGGIIIPGLKTALDSLVTKTAKLPRISLAAPQKVVGRNTIDSMKSGMIYGNAACIDGLLERIEHELDHPVTAIATGGLADKVLPYCKKTIIIDQALLLKGLNEVYEKNKEHI